MWAAGHKTLGGGMHKVLPTSRVPQKQGPARWRTDRSLLIDNLTHQEPHDGQHTMQGGQLAPMAPYRNEHAYAVPVLERRSGNSTLKVLYYEQRKVTFSEKTADINSYMK